MRPPGGRAAHERARILRPTAGRGLEKFVHEADLRLEAGIDSALPDAAVTTALCGHWEHAGPCRWLHANEIETSGPTARFRTVFEAVPEEELAVREKIDAALRGGPGWVVVRTVSS